MNTDIKPIETHYKGYRFRSRLEARWAVFFDALGIQWEYEHEGYELIIEYGEESPRTEWYLPDFWLPTFNGGIFTEVKPTNSGFDKTAALVSQTGIIAWLCDGTPDAKVYRYLTTSRDDLCEYEYETHEMETGVPGAIVFENWGIPNCWDAIGENRFWYVNDPWNYPEQSRTDSVIFGDNVKKAVRAARSARFDRR